MKEPARRATRSKGITVGSDVPQKFIEVVILDENGEEEWGGRVTASPVGLIVSVEPDRDVELDVLLSPE